MLILRKNPSKERERGRQLERRKEEITVSHSQNANVLCHQTQPFVCLLQCSIDSDRLFKLWRIAAPPHRYLFCTWFGNTAYPAIGILAFVHQYESTSLRDSCYDPNQPNLTQVLRRFGCQIINRQNTACTFRLLIFPINPQRKERES